MNKAAHQMKSFPLRHFMSLQHGKYPLVGETQPLFPALSHPMASKTTCFHYSRHPQVSDDSVRKKDNLLSPFAAPRSHPVTKTTCLRMTSIQLRNSAKKYVVLSMAYSLSRSPRTRKSFMKLLFTCSRCTASSGGYECMQV